MHRSFHQPVLIPNCQISAFCHGPFCVRTRFHLASGRDARGFNVKRRRVATWDENALLFIRYLIQPSCAAIKIWFWWLGLYILPLLSTTVKLWVPVTKAACVKSLHNFFITCHWKPFVFLVNPMILFFKYDNHLLNWFHFNLNLLTWLFHQQPTLQFYISSLKSHLFLLFSVTVNSLQFKTLHRLIKCIDLFSRVQSIYKIKNTVKFQLIRKWQIYS